MCIALPVKVNTTVRGQHMQLSTETNYPFGEKVVVRVEAAPDSATSISLRLPTWCSSPTITVNSVPVEGIQPATFARIERIWKAGDTIELHLPMQISLKEGISRSVSVHRGPLVFALSISQRRAVHKREGPKNFDSIEFYPGADWNYGLLIDRENPSSSFEVVERPMPMNPFDRDSTPIVLKAQARKIDEWTLEPKGRYAYDPPLSPVHSDAPKESIALVPFGAGILRLANLPVIGKSSELAKRGLYRSL